MDEWFKVKRYPHIGLPITQKEKKMVVNYIKNSNNIIRHQFRPLIQRKVVNCPHRVNDKGERRRKSKVRLLTYASHIDSNIYAYYASRLQTAYEDFIKDNELNNVVVAYRKIKSEDGKGNKCNIHIANDVFSYCKRELNAGRELAVITFDIKGFFDNLDHRIIKKTWKQIMRYENIPNDEYAVYRSVVKYSYIEEYKIFNLFKGNIICLNSSNKFKPRSIKSLRYLKSRNAVAYCNTDGIIKIKQYGLLNIHKSQKGIPQGLPISAVLANMYMKDFDLGVNSFIQSLGGIYKRYSDDIIVVCPIANAKESRTFVMNEIKKVELEIEERKTNLFEIHLVFGKALCYHETKGLKQPLEYLGFSFDGERILLKNASLSKYYFKMNIDKRRHKHWLMKINNNTNGKLFTNQIIRRFTFAGAKRHHIFYRTSAGKFLKQQEKTHGNYLTYALKAADIMGEQRIKHQLRHNLHKVKSNIKEITTNN